MTCKRIKKDTESGKVIAAVTSLSTLEMKYEKGGERVLKVLIKNYGENYSWSCQPKHFASHEPQIKVLTSFAIRKAFGCETKR